MAVTAPTLGQEAAIARLFEYCAAICTVDLPTLTATSPGWPCPVPAMTQLGAYGWELDAVVAIPARSGEFVAFFRRDVVAPTLQSLNPSSARLGSPSFTLRVKGAGFNTTTEILWNGSPEATTYVSSTEVSTGVNMETASVAIEIPVGVRNGVVVSPTTLLFTFLPEIVEEPVATATLTALEPNTAQLGAPDFLLRVLGTGFTPESVIAVNGVDIATTYISGTELTHLVTMANATAEGMIDVTIRTGTVVSNPMPFTLTAPPPAPE